jgi:hypothetical protein
MPSFHDNEKRPWTLRVDVNIIRRVRSATGIDLARVLTTASGREAMHDDVCLFVDVLWEMVAEQASAKGITPEQFGQSLTGDALGAAALAFEEAIVEFLPESQGRAIARTVIDGGRTLQAKSKQLIREAMDKGLVEQGIESELDRLRSELTAITIRQKHPPTTQPTTQPNPETVRAS